MVANDRGQLVLVGAVAIAFIVVGIVVVFNGVVFTESTGDQGTVVDTKDGGSIGLSTERNLREAAHAGNTKAEHSDNDSARDAVGDAVASTSPYLATQEAESGGAMTDVSLVRSTNNGTWMKGRHEEIDSEGNVTSGTQYDNYKMEITDATSNGGELATGPFGGAGQITIKVEDESFDTINISGSPVSGDCSGLGTPVLIDFTNGFVDDSGCDLSDGLTDGGTELQFEYEDGLEGTYQLITESEDPLNDPGADTHNIIWSAEYRILYDAGQVDSVAEEQEVDHYG